MGSLEEKVQRIVKSLEMELQHKIRPEDFKSVNREKFRFSVNGDSLYQPHAAAEVDQI